jgi:hypothetical protein
LRRFTYCLLERSQTLIDGTHLVAERSPEIVDLTHDVDVLRTAPGLLRALGVGRLYENAARRVGDQDALSLEQVNGALGGVEGDAVLPGQGSAGRKPLAKPVHPLLD